MPICNLKNGRWHADACRCYKFWTGTSCDRRLCARGAGVLRPEDGLCRCRPGFGGEFCQYEICRHDSRWYCNTTEMAPRTIWDEVDENARPVEPCADEIIQNWFQPPTTVTPAWYCNCGSGLRETLSNDTQLLSDHCACQRGYYGVFCEKHICDTNGSIWRAENGTCVGPFKIDHCPKGYFGCDINQELTGATIALFTLIAIFVIIGRWYLRKVDREARERDENNWAQQKLEKRKHKAKVMKSYGFGQRHSSAYEKRESASAASFGSRRSSTWSDAAPVKRKQGNTTPITSPVLKLKYDYKNFYEPVPPSAEFGFVGGQELELISDSGRSRSPTKSDNQDMV